MAGLESVGMYGSAEDLYPANYRESEEVLDGFDQLVAMLPNLSPPAISYHSHQPVSVHAENGHSPSRQAERASQKMSAAERKQHKNRLAQKRFRDRQKVLTFTATLLNMQSHLDV